VAFLIAILTLVLAALVVLVVSAPLRRAREAERSTSDAEARSAPGDVPAVPGGYTRNELEAAREAKYREIRDAELDFRTGKLSPEDYQAIDADLRAEAIEILNRIERQTEAPSAATNGSADAPAG
jgi:hypothetical protein